MTEPDAPMTRDEVLDVFRSCDALLEGHFILTSGRHAATYFQKSLVFRQPEKTEIICRALARKIEAAGLPEFTQVVSPAVGGIIPGYETARQLGKPAIYTERVNGEFQLRRNFEVAAGENVIIVEDIVSTGLSIRECVAAVQGMGANVLAAACLVDRSAGKVDVGVPLISLIEFEVPSYPADALPPELAAIPAVKPGSRGLH